MDMKDHLINMAKYHKWAYEKFFDALDSADDTDYFADKGLFFKSIHKSLNHLYLVDVLWLSRFEKTSPPITRLDQELIEDRESLKKAIFIQADLWIDFVKNIDKHPEILCYFNQIDGTEAKRPYLSIIAHVFNHGTHHRGQITTILSQLNLPTPVLDYNFYLLDNMN
jgi:uncharacterized damage-inducible protein DinB